MTIDTLYNIYLKHPVISTDTRRIAPGSLFFALKGDKFDANTFAARAIEAGAAYAVIDNAQYRVSEQYILVDDVLETLQDLARYHRSRIKIPVVGLTGTNGKTTTKELINAVLSQHFKTWATQGNLNNHIGVPLTILSIDASHQAAVIEMGANHQYEIELLCTIAQPTHGMITNVGKAHLEGFGSIEGVKKAKGELYDYMASRHHQDSVVFVNSDDATLMEMAGSRALKHVIHYGTGNTDNFIHGKLVDNSPHLVLQWHERGSSITHTVKTQLTGAYNLDNILAAIAIGTYLGLPPDEINTGIEGYQPKNNRSQIVQIATNTLICDYYNANPSSMAVAIDNIDKIQAENKVLILGDMFEMGAEAEAEHRAIIEKALVTDAKSIFIGKEFYKQRGAFESQADFYPSIEDAISGLHEKPLTNATVLLKGSRGMALEKLVELF